MQYVYVAYENSYISAARSGGSAFILLTAIVALIQQPGSDSQRFGASVYFVVFGVLLSFSVVAYYYLTVAKIGHRSTESVSIKLEVMNSDENRIITSQTASNHHSDEKHQQPEEKPDLGSDLLHDDQEMQHRSSATEVVPDTGTATNPMLLSTDSHLLCSSDAVSHPAAERAVESAESAGAEEDQGSCSQVALALARWQQKVLAVLVPESVHERIPYLRDALPYILAVGYVNFNTWGMVTALFPFAIDNSSESSSSTNLAIAYQLGAFMLVLGRYLSISITISISI